MLFHGAYDWAALLLKHLIPATFTALLNLVGAKGLQSHLKLKGPKTKIVEFSNCVEPVDQCIDTKLYTVCGQLGPVQ